jgi:hypothetical protein
MSSLNISIRTGSLAHIVGRLDEAPSAEQRVDYGDATARARCALKAIETAPEAVDGLNVERLCLQAQGFLGKLHRSLAHYEEAETIFREVLNRSIELFGTNSDEACLARNNVGVLYKYTRKFDRGEALYTEVLHNLIEMYGELNSWVATLYHDFGSLFNAASAFVQQKAVVLATFRSKLGGRYSKTIMAYGNVQTAKPDFLEQEVLLRCRAFPYIVCLRIKSN